MLWSNRTKPTDPFERIDALASQALALELTRWNHPAIRGLPAEARLTIAECLASAVNSAVPRTPPSSEGVRIGEDMKREGIARVGRALSSVQIDEIRRYFAGRPCYNLHYEGHKKGDGVGRLVGQGAEMFAFGSYTREDSLRAPHLFQALTSDTILDAVEEYLGARPMLFSINTYWSFAGHPQSIYGQDFHRDMSHPHFCVLFIYLTDADAESGAHEYIRCTHRISALAAQLEGRGGNERAREIFSLPLDGTRQEALYREHLSHLIETIDGPAGTAFIEDTYGIHRGIPPKSKPRLAAWARYSLFPKVPDIEKSDRAVLADRYPTSERHRYVLRGILDDARP